jgi:hypothetical protein
MAEDDSDSLGSVAMEEDEDDLYNDSPPVQKAQQLQEDEDDYEPEEDDSDSVCISRPLPAQ